MAKHLNLSYTIGVNADTSKLESSLKQAFASLNKVNSLSLTEGLNEANQAAVSLATNLRTAINQGTGKLDLITFNKNLKNSGETLTSYYKKLTLMGTEGEQAFLKVAKSITQAELPLKRSNHLLSELWVTMKNTVRWQLTSSALHGFVGALEQAYGYTKNLDKSLNNIRIVTGKNAEEMSKFADQANRAAKALSTTTRDYTDASLIYYQQGLSDEEVLKRTETTIKMANVSGITAETASDQLTAIWNNFYDGSKNLEYYADVLVKLGAATASSSDEISEGVEKFAAVAGTIGLSYDYAASALATVTAKTRESADVVGTAFRTLFSRIQGLQLGETLDDGTTLNKYSSALAKVGVDIKDSNGELKEMDVILEDLGSKWNNLSKDQQIALAETVAGVRQWTQLIALMDSWDFFKENLTIAQGSSGALKEQAQIYAESWEAARDRVKASAEDIYDSIINKDFFISFDNVLAKILDRTADLVDGMGGFAGILATLSKLAFTVYGDKIEQNIRSMVQNLGIAAGLEQARSRSLQEEAASLIKMGNVGNYDNDSILRSRLEITQAEVDYQTKLNREMDKMTDSEKAIVASLREAVNLKKEEYELAVSQARSLENEVTERAFAIEIDANYRGKGNKNQSYEDMWALKGLTGVKTTDRWGNSKEIEDYIEEALYPLSTAYQDATTQYSKFIALKSKGIAFFEDNSDAVKKLAQNLGFTEEEINNIISSNDPFKTVLQGVRDAEANLETYRNALIEIFQLKPEQLSSFENIILRQVQVMAQAILKGQEYKTSLEGSLGVAQKFTTITHDFAANVVGIGRVASSVAMLTTAFRGLFNALSDDSLTGAEKFTAILGSMGMILPNIISLFNQLGNVKVVSLLTSRISEAILATKTWQAAINEKTEVEVKELAILVAKHLVIVAIIAAIAILAAGIYLLVKALNADKEAAKEAAAGLEELSNQYEEAKAKAEELKEVINNWDEAVNAIGELRKGTEKYKEAIEDANNKAKELIETYKLFDTGDWYYDAEGIIKFREGVLEDIQNQADNEVSTLQNSIALASITSTNANNKVSTSDLGDIYQLSLDPNYKPPDDVTVEKFLDVYKAIVNETPSITDDDLMQKLLDELGTIFDSTKFKELRKATDDYLKSIKEASKGNDYYAKQIVKNDVTGKYGSQISTTANGNSGLEIALTNLYTQIETDQFKENYTEPSNVGSNAALSKFLQENGEEGFSGDEELAKLFLRYVKGWTDEEIGAVTYKGGKGVGNFYQADGSLLWDEDLSDKWMRKMIAQKVATDKILKNVGVSDENQSIINDLIDQLVEIGGQDLATGVLNSLANGDEALDLSSVFAEFSPEDIEEILNKLSEGKNISEILGITPEQLKELGIEDGEGWLNSFEDALSEYDPQLFYDKLYSAAGVGQEVAQSLIEQLYSGDITSENIKDNEAYTTLITQLESLKDEFPELAILYAELSKAWNVGTTSFTDALIVAQRRLSELDFQGLLDQQKEAQANLQKYFKKRRHKGGDITLEVELDTEEAQQVLDDFLEADYALEIEAHIQGENEFDNFISKIENIENAASKIGDGFIIAASDIRELGNAFPGILEGMTKVSDGSYRLKEEVVNNVMDATRQSMQYEALETAQYLKDQGDKLSTQADTYDKMAEAAGIMAQAELDSSIDTTDAISTLNEGLFSDKTENSGQAAEDVLDDEAKIATSSQINAGITAENWATASNSMVNSTARAATLMIQNLEAVTDMNRGKIVHNASIHSLYSGRSGQLISLSDRTSIENDVQGLLDEGGSAQKWLEAQAKLEALAASLREASNDMYNAATEVAARGESALNSVGRSGTESGSGSSYDKEDLENLEEVEDRYREINRLIEKQSNLLDKLSTSTERTWGQPALENYIKEIEELQKQQENYNTKLEKARKYQLQDAQAVKGYFKDAEFASDGELLNQEELIRLSKELYNEKVNIYNNAIELGKFSEDELKTLKEQLETEKEKMQARQDAIDQYNETLDLVRELYDTIQETAQTIADKKLEQIKFKMEMVLDLKSMQDNVRDLAQDIAEMFGDALTHGLSSATMDADRAQVEAGLLSSYQEEWNSLKALYEDATTDADRRAIMDEIQSLQDNIINSAQAIAEWANSIEDIVPDAIDAAAERFSAFTDQLEHNTSILDTIKELYALQGVTYKTMDGFNRLQKTSQEKLEAQVVSAQLQRSWYEEASKRLQEAQAKLDSLGGNENDLRYDAYKKARDAYLEEFNEAQEAYLSSAKEAMETAQDMYLQQIEKAVYEFGQAVSNGVGLDLLQDKYDHYIEQNERYFDKVNEAYQVSAWYNKLQQDIDDTTNSAHKERLKALQEEINQRREGNKLSQYDLDILNAKYQVLQAQMALEDAQNAKNKIQLVRDSQGNWNYQYTADQDQIANAEQDLLDAENDWYNIAKQQVTDVTGEIISTWSECQEKIKEIYSDMTLTDEERANRAAEIYNYYSEKIKYLEEEKQNAISDISEAGNKNLIDNAILTGDTITDLTGLTAEELKQIVENYTGDITDLLQMNSAQIEEIFGNNMKFVDLFDNTYAKDLANMTQNATNFEEQLRKLLEQAQQDFDNYKDKVEEVANETGTNLDDLAAETDKVSNATDQLTQKGSALNTVLWGMIDAAQSASDSYLMMAESLWQAVTALQALARAQLNYNTAYTGSNQDMSVDFGTYDKNTDYSAMIEQGIVNGYISYGDDIFNRLVAQRDAKILGEGMGSVQGSAPFASMTRGGTLSSYGSQYYTSYSEWLANLEKLKSQYGLATGGYTGVFDDTRLAFLHEKELVLNQTDTENILATVQLVRDLSSDLFGSIEKTLDSNVIAAMSLMGQRLNPIVATPVQDSIEQTVHIDKVEFPNVTSRTEIEEAFVNLTNDAAQWARRKS